MSPSKPSFAKAIIKVGNGIAREEAWLRSEIRLRLPKLTHTELCAVKDLVTTMVKERGRIGPRKSALHAEAAAMIDHFAFPDELELTKIEAALAALLVSRERVSSLVAFEVLYGDRPEENRPQFETVKVHISHIRKKLVRLYLNLRIDTAWGWGWGWRMPVADRDKLKARMRSIERDER
jgi:hypothetical protein